QRQHVLAEALRVGGRMAGLEDAAVDAAAEMLDEGAEQARMGAADREIAMATDLDVTHGRLRLGLRETGPSSSGAVNRDAADCRAPCGRRRSPPRCPGA